MQTNEKGSSSENQAEKAVFTQKVRCSLKRGSKPQAEGGERRTCKTAPQTEEGTAMKKIRYLGGNRVLSRRARMSGVKPFPKVKQRWAFR